MKKGGLQGGGGGNTGMMGASGMNGASRGGIASMNNTQTKAKGNTPVLNK